MKKIRIVIADGNNLFVEALKAILEKEQEINVLSASDAGVSALRSCIDLAPDVAVIGEVLPDLTMLETAKELKRIVRNIGFLFIVKEGGAGLLDLLNGSDPVGAIKQSSDIPEFLRALRFVADGERYVSPGIIEKLKVPDLTGISAYDPLSDITHREREVLYWAAHGMTNKEISNKIFLSEKTVKNHISSILKKLEITDRTKAAALAWKEGLPLLPEDFFMPGR